MNILVTEDNDVGRRVMELFLTPYGNVSTASRGEDALKRFWAGHKHGVPFDLIFQDLGMPGKSGLEVLQEIREYERKTKISDPVKVIILTGTSDPGQKASALGLGAAKFLLKPVGETELLAHLKDLGLVEK